MIHKNKSKYVGKVVQSKSYGEAEAIEVVDRKHVRVKFLDTGDKTHIFQKGHFERGAIRDPYRPIRYGVGYSGEGVYSKDSSKEMKHVFQIWVDMLRRCYCEKTLQKRPTYKGCTVCDEWHNFQNFADWYINHEFYGLGYELDKDLLVSGNKIYSPNTCCLIPSILNATLQTGRNRESSLPRGVSKHSGSGYITKLVTQDYGNLYKRFATVEEASVFYKKMKKEDLINRAEKWKYLVAVDVYESLLNFEV